MATRPSRKRTYEGEKAVKAYTAKCRAAGPAYCYFCGKHIDMNLHYHDKWAFTVQHITPVSRGGGDTEDNFAPAHRSCNAREGNRLAGTRTEDGDMTMGPKLKQSRVW
jgi:5-methylcytosine-specific restriction endonuclease McrA